MCLIGILAFVKNCLSYRDVFTSMTKGMWLFNFNSKTKLEFSAIELVEFFFAPLGPSERALILGEHDNLVQRGWFFGKMKFTDTDGPSFI